MFTTDPAGVAVDDGGFTTILSIPRDQQTTRLVIVNPDAVDGFWTLDDGVHQMRWVKGDKKLGLPIEINGACNVKFKCDDGSTSNAMWAYAY